MTTISGHTGTIADLQALVAQHEKTGVHESILAIGGFLLDIASTPLHDSKAPFSKEYFDRVKELWSIIAARPDYDPQRDELAPYLDSIPALGPIGELNPVSSRFAGEQLLGAGFIMQQLDMSRDQSLLEYGPGQGKIALQIARLGCKVAVIDIEARYLDKIKEQADALRLVVETQQGVFGDAFGGGRLFDRILFYEAFHHSLDHALVLRRLHDHLELGGYIVFAAEPVIIPGGPWDKVVPFPWGPRLDGLSVHAMRTHGWCELGFRQDYFVELLMRSGYLVTFNPCPGSDLGSCYIARPHRGRVEMGERFMIAISGEEVGWHEPEAGQRYTKSRTLFPLDQMAEANSVVVEFFNFIPVEKVVQVTIGGDVRTVTFSGGEARQERFQIPKDSPRIEFATQVGSIAPYVGEHDRREVGIGVRSITYETGVV